MTVCRADHAAVRSGRRAATGFVLTVLAAIPIASALAQAPLDHALLARTPFIQAQAGPPVRLGPPVHLRPPPAAETAPALPEPDRPPEMRPLDPRALWPAPDMPGSGPPAAFGVAPPGSGEARRPAGIAVEALGRPGLDGLAAIGAAEGGFSTGIWARSDRKLVAALLSGLPTASPSPTARALAVRLALSPALPAGEAAGVPDGTLLRLRLQRLIHGGAFEAATDLAGVIPAAVLDDELAWMLAELALLRGDDATACARAAGAEAVTPAWQELRSHCAFGNGDIAAAMLRVDLLREDGQGDPLFAALALRRSGVAAAELPAAGPLTPLQLAAWAAAGAEDMAPGSLDDVPPAVLRAVSAEPRMPLRLRLLAAERALPGGAIPPAELARLLAALSFDPGQRRSPVEAAAGMPGLRGSALLLRALGGPDLPDSVRHAAWRALWTRSGREDWRLPAAALAGSALAGLQPVGDHAGQADTLAAGLFLAGRPEPALAWFRAAEARAPADAGATAAAARAWPLLRLAELDPAARTDPRRLAEAGAAGGPLARHLLLLAALGEPADAALAAAVTAELEAPAVASGGAGDAVWRALTAAAASERTGETILAALIALDRAGGPARADGAVLAAVVAALVRAGLPGEARALALEAAAAALP